MVLGEAEFDIVIFGHANTQNQQQSAHIGPGREQKGL